ncbi:MAG: hypothetical protein Q9219_004661 [cf. Caloplaca sp. 3 TL-2023]
MTPSIPSLLKTISLKGATFWKILAVIFALINLKYTPFAWHLRILNGLLTHIPFTSSRLRARKQLTPSSLFQPLILNSRAQPFEIDYNFHKSNSTYFSDFDIARLHLMVRLCSVGLARTSDELWLADNKNGPRNIRIMMGGVSCNFRREIKPLQAFEMWTRVLCWDRKWFYIVGFFVEKGKVRPNGWTLQPWRNGKHKDGVEDGEEARGTLDEEKEKRKGAHLLIFATGLAKYVCKRGRLTVPPERILQASGLLPIKTADSDTPPSTITESPAVPVEGDAIPSSAAAPMPLAQDMTSTAAEQLMDAALKVKPLARDVWDWEGIERERQRGMKIAEAWSQTEGLGEEFLGDERPALGTYWDSF